MTSALAGVALALSPLAAHAATTLSATGTGWGPDWGTAITQANAEANGNLYELARSKGLTCTDVTDTDSLTYIVPGGGGYVFTATATGQCS